MRRALLILTLAAAPFLLPACQLINPLAYTKPPHICILRWTAVGPVEADLDAVQSDVLANTRATCAVSRMLETIIPTLSPSQRATLQAARSAMWELDARLDAAYTWRLCVWDMWWNRYDGSTADFWTP